MKYSRRSMQTEPGDWETLHMFIKSRAWKLMEGVWEVFTIFIFTLLPSASSYPLPFFTARNWSWSESDWKEWEQRIGRVASVHSLVSNYRALVEHLSPSSRFWEWNPSCVSSSEMQVKRDMGWTSCSRRPSKMPCIFLRTWGGKKEAEKNGKKEEKMERRCDLCKTF